MTNDEIKSAVARARDESFAQMLLLQIGLVAETHPDILKKALSSVFDLTIWENNARKISADILEQSKKLSELRMGIRDATDELNRLRAKVVEIAESVTEFIGE